MALELAIDNFPIPLYQVLKLTNLVGGGGEAKIAITNGYVAVNDHVEYQKRKKIVAGDEITFNGETIFVVQADDCHQTDDPMFALQPEEQYQSPVSSAANKPSSKTKQKPQPSSNEPAVPPKGRKPISF